MSLDVSLADAELIASTMWPDEAAAREQATLLEKAGYRVTHHDPALQSSYSSSLRAASVTDPGTDRFIGDVWFTPPGVTAADAKELTPVQWLLMQALAARTQLGSPFWTVRRARLGHALRELLEAGLIGAQSVTDHHVRVWLTDAGRAAQSAPEGQSDW